MLDWFRDWMGFPPTTRGLFTTGGSMSIFNAILCARERLLGTEIRSGVLYTSTQAHASVVKSARLAGILPDRVRMVPVDEQFRMRVEALGEEIDADRRAGLRPFLVVSTAGTTNTGAVDPLEAIADLCDRAGLWHHVDGAYGAFFHLVEPLRPLLAGLPRADSLTLDPHKGLFLPYGTGALLVRDGSALRAVHGMHAGYLPPAADLEFYDAAQHGPELSRGLPGAAGLADDQDLRRRPAAGRDCREASAGRRGRRAAGPRARDRAGCPAAALAVRLPPRAARRLARRAG